MGRGRGADKVICTIPTSGPADVKGVRGNPGDVGW